MEKLGTGWTFTSLYSLEKLGNVPSVPGLRDSVVAAAQLLPLRPPSVTRAHLDRRPTGDGSLAPPRQRLVQVSGVQHPKTAYVLLGL